MKVISSIDNCYQQQLDLNKELKNKVDDIIKTNKKTKWHYESRIKPEESFALKIETGRIEDPTKLEDFFACLIVVKNSIEINKALDLVDGFFTIAYRRPPEDNFTHKSPESFPYDDLRLYVKLKPTEGLPPESPFNKLSNIIFEIQIKTFLQHSWSLATYDLIYKGEEISWAKRRVAYQIKAMLEHAEISIYEIEKIKESDMLAKLNKNIKQLNQIKEFLIKNWQQDTLPNDLVRLSESVHFLLKQLDVTLDELQVFLDAEFKEGRGTQTTNLSPYFIIVQTIINRNPQKVTDFFSDENDTSKIVIPSEITTNEITLTDDKVIRF